LRRSRRALQGRDLEEDFNGRDVVPLQVSGEMNELANSLVAWPGAAETFGFGTDAAIDLRDRHSLHRRPLDDVEQAPRVTRSDLHPSIVAANGSGSGLNFVTTNRK